MDPARQRALTEILLALVPADGTPVGNQHLRQQFIEAARAKAHKASEAQFDQLGEAVLVDRVVPMLSYGHPNKRKNNPQVYTTSEITDSCACMNRATVFALSVGSFGMIQSNPGMGRQ